MRIPRLHDTHKTTIDYSSLDRHTHSKIETVSSIPHETEVLKCRQNPFHDKTFGSVHTDGNIGIYKLGEGLVSKLKGLTEETFALSWSPKRDGFIASTAGSTICIWDVN